MFGDSGRPSGLQLSRDLTLPVKVAQEVNLILGTRGYGKCLDGDTRVLLSDGREVPIKELGDEEREVVSLGSDMKMVPARSIDLTSRVVDKMLRIRFRSGRELKLTHEHPLLDVDGWRGAGDFCVGEMVATPRKIEFFGHREIEDSVTLATSDIFWDEIVEIEELEGEFTVYDICVPEHHNFVANGCIVHNSWTLGVFLEELHKNGVQFCVFDPLGAHRAIDLPGVKVVDVRNGQTVNIDKLVRGLMNSSSSVIINMMDLTEPASSGTGTRQQELVGRYAQEILNANPASRNKVIVTVIEEAEEFAPMGNAKYVYESIIPLNRLTKMGRARGCGVTFVTQRPQDFSSKLRSQVSNFIVHRLTNYTELDVMKKQLVAATRGEAKPIIQKIFSFGEGEVMILSPSVSDGIAFTKIRMRETEHAGSNVLDSDGSYVPPSGLGLGGDFVDDEPVAFGSKEDLTEIITPVEAIKKKSDGDKLGLTIGVFLLATAGVTGWIVWKRHQEGKEKSFMAMEEQYSAVRDAIEDADDVGDDSSSSGAPDLESIEELDRGSRELLLDNQSSSIGETMAPTISNYDMEPTDDPFDYDPFSPR